MTPDQNPRHRNRKVTVRFLHSEYEQLYAAFKRSTHREFSAFLRQFLLKKKITVYTHNRSLDDLVSELALLRRALEGVRLDVSRAPEKPLSKPSANAIQNQGLILTGEAQNLLEKLDQVQDQITQIEDLWWPGSTAPRD